MRIVKIVLGLVALWIMLLVGGFMLNDIPWGAPPGPVIRAYTYLTTHVAETIEGSPFPELRPRRYTRDADSLYRTVQEAVTRLPRWEIAATDDTARTVQAVVTSRIFRFKDDVTITVVPEPGGHPVVQVRSESRVAKGDLGTNTQHVLDLYAMLEELGAHGEVERMSGTGGTPPA